MDDNTSIQHIAESIGEATVISILFPALRRSLVVDTRQDEVSGCMVQIMPQVPSFDERIKKIEAMRPDLGKVRAILGIPWMRPVRELEDARIPDRLIERLIAAGLSRSEAHIQVSVAIRQLKRYEKLAFARLIGGPGFKTLWSSTAGR